MGFLGGGAREVKRAGEVPTVSWAWRRSRILAVDRCVQGASPEAGLTLAAVRVGLCPAHPLRLADRLFSSPSALTGVRSRVAEREADCWGCFSHPALPHAPSEKAGVTSTGLAAWSP